MNFIPSQTIEAQEVPYFEDAKKSEGWQGQATEKAAKVLKSEIREALSRLGGQITTFQQGAFQINELSRDGFQIGYVVEAADGRQVSGRINIAALPVRIDTPKRRDQSLRMALYMLRVSLDGSWLFQQLSPGYSALVPFMLGSGNKTVSEIWLDSPIMNKLLPPGKQDFIEGEVKVL